MFKVAVIGQDELTVRMFRETEGAEVTILENPLKEAERPDKYDLVVFTGGSDVTPWLYGERNTTSYNNLQRDIRELLWFHRFLNTPKIGICRGGQFLFSMSGGIMEQHIDGHGDSHKLKFQVWDPMVGNSVTSTHHQHMAFPRADMSVLAMSTDNKNEVVWCAYTKSLCFQPHPEYDDEICRKIFFWYLNKIYKLDFFKFQKAREAENGLRNVINAAINEQVNEQVVGRRRAPAPRPPVAAMWQPLEEADFEVVRAPRDEEDEEGNN